MEEGAKMDYFNLWAKDFEKDLIASGISSKGLSVSAYGSYLIISFISHRLCLVRTETRAM